MVCWYFFQTQHIVWHDYCPVYLFSCNNVRRIKTKRSTGNVIALINKGRGEPMAEGWQIPLEHDDFRAIFKKAHVTPAEWLQIQRIWLQRRKKALYNEDSLNIYSCLCRSPWCPKCAKIGPTATKIRDRLGILPWDSVRQVVLTVSRETPPDITMAKIRKNRAIPKMVRKIGLSGARWLWVLEFHRGGFPHWHLFIETTRGKSGMIGKKRVQKAWKYGLVWETYCKNKQHWEALCGYHRKNGYFASESKQHQLELPDYLKGQNRVRKFASNYVTEVENTRKEASKANLEAAQSPPKPSKKAPKRVQRSYREKIGACNKAGIIHRNGAYLKVNIPGSRLREIAREIFDEIDFKTFNGDTSDVFSFLDAIALASDQG
jgi:hypothetical protein